LIGSSAHNAVPRDKEKSAGVPEAEFAIRLRPLESESMSTFHTFRIRATKNHGRRCVRGARAPVLVSFSAIVFTECQPPVFPSFYFPAISPATKTILQKIPLLTVKAGPRDGDEWMARLKEEYSRLIEYIRINKEMDNDWFRIESNKTGTRCAQRDEFLHVMLCHISCTFQVVIFNLFHHMNNRDFHFAGGRARAGISMKIPNMSLTCSSRSQSRTR